MWFHLGKIFLPMIVLIVYLLSCQDTAAVHSKLTGLLSQRRLRRQTGTPVPIDCQLSQWSEWTECFPCQDKKYRYRTLLQPSKYKGCTCTGSLWEKVQCEPTRACTRRQDCGTDFQCKESGRCIKRHLVCNGEPDCRDMSDEADCEDAESFCDHLDPIPGVERLAQGYNILTQKGADIVYDPTYYGGQCESVYNGEWREEKYDPICENLYYGEDEKYFRKPYNVHFYQFLAHADSGFSTEYFDNAKDLLNAIQRENSWNAGVTVGVGLLDLPLTPELGATFSLGQGTLRNITEYASKNLGFIRTLTKVQTARFKMKRDNIILDEDMLQSLMELPDQYNYGMYTNFINTYGTHFMTSGTMGGVFEYILVINQDKMKKAGHVKTCPVVITIIQSEWAVLSEQTSGMVMMDATDIQQQWSDKILQNRLKGLTAEICLDKIKRDTISVCYGASLGLKLTPEIELFEVSTKVSVEACVTGAGQTTGIVGVNSVIEDIIPRVRGGDTASIGRLMEGSSTNAYRYWGRSLKLNPAVIDFELQPIDEILHRTQLPHMEIKRKNLKRALNEYLIEFNACRCGPCHNNGEPMLIGSSCVCECQKGAHGPACENTMRAGDPIHGSWSCWAPWTSCQNGSRRRTRECTNPEPQNGGRTCPGRSAQTAAC